MGDAVRVREWDEQRLTAAASVATGEIWQTPDGKAAVYQGLNAGNSGDRVEFSKSGHFTMTKATGFVALRGGRAYWDHSANNVNYKKVNDRDFYVGRFVDDAASTDTTCVVDLNADPPYDIDLNVSAFATTLVGTAAAGAFGYPVVLGGSRILELTATNEAQKVDLLSVDGFSKSANAIIECVFRVLSDGAGTVVDCNIGVANGTHASDADSITESVFVHLDANNTNINVESDDGTTEVAATDTTLDYTEGAAVANRVEFWIDMRDPADVQIYVNGALVLGSTVFNVDAATGPLFLLAHLEKSSSTDTYKIAIDRFCAHYMEQ